MCCECWKDCGKPRIDTPAVRELGGLIKGFLEDFPSGGGLHIVLDDWNLEDSHIKWCRRDGQHHGWDERADRICDGLLALTVKGRAAVLGLAEGCWGQGHGVGG